MSGEEKKYWLDDHANVKKVIITLFVVCGLLFIADFFYHKHSHFAAEDFFGFYAKNTEKMGQKLPQNFDFSI